MENQVSHYLRTTPHQTLKIARCERPVSLRHGISDTHELPTGHDRLRQPRVGWPALVQEPGEVVRRGSFVDDQPGPGFRSAPKIFPKLRSRLEGREAGIAVETVGDAILKPDVRRRAMERSDPALEIEPDDKRPAGFMLGGRAA